MRHVVLGLAALITIAATSTPARADAVGAQAQKLLANAGKVATEVAKIRGLAIRKSIARGVMSREQLKERLLKRVEQDYSPDEIAAEQLLLKRFGLLKENDDYLKIVIALLTEQIAGFYDPWERQLYLANFQLVGGDVLMAHEIDHALQDQHFNLRKFMGKGKNNNDATAARQALVEGDGMAVMIEFMLAGLGQAAPWGNDAVVKAISSQMAGASGFGSFDKAPLFLKEGLLFPYLSGLKFVAHFRKTHPWQRVDRIYAKPPLSSEHILHPELYESYERPDEVSAVSLSALPGAKLVHHDVQGELGLMVWLMQQGVSRPRAELAAAGWGGDRVAVLASSAQAELRSSVGISMSVWDDEADAIEFFEAALDALRTLSGVAPVAGTVTVFPGANGMSAIERRGDRVVIVHGLAKDLASPDQVVGEVFARWAVKSR